MKRNEMLTHAAAWMNLQNNTLSEISLSQKTTFEAFVYMKGPQKANL